MQALTSRDLQSGLGSARSCLEEAIDPRGRKNTQKKDRKKKKNAVCGNLRHQGNNVGGAKSVRAGVQPPVISNMDLEHRGQREL